MKRTFTTLVLLLLALNYSKAQLSNGLVGHYPFNNNLNDISPSGNNGVSTGTIRYVNDKNNQSNSALEFYNDASFIPCAVDANISNVDSLSFSISFWLKPSDSAIKTAKIINVGYNNSAPVWSIEQFKNTKDSVNLNIYAYADKDYTNLTQNYIRLGKNWNFVTITFLANDSLIAYSNGVKKNSVYVPLSYKLHSKPNNMRFGNLSQNYATLYNPIDEFRLYNRKLSGSEVKQLYNLNSLSIANTIAKYKIIAYPNPTTNLIEISGVDLLNKKIELSNSDGKVINTEVKDNKIDISNLSSGIYFILVKSSLGEIEAIEKIIKN